MCIVVVFVGIDLGVTFIQHWRGSIEDWFQLLMIGNPGLRLRSQIFVFFVRTSQNKKHSPL